MKRYEISVNENGRDTKRYEIGHGGAETRSEMKRNIKYFTADLKRDRRLVEIRLSKTPSYRLDA